jgi:hypothetical protein
VAAAREAAWNEDRSSNTWAAYQAYGDPNWVYRRSAGETPQRTLAPREEFEGIASPLGLALALEEQAVDALDARRRLASQLTQIAPPGRALLPRCAQAWARSAEAFALAYAEANDRDAAIAGTSEALVANDGSASMKASETAGQPAGRQRG